MQGRSLAQRNLKGRTVDPCDVRESPVVMFSSVYFEVADYKYSWVTIYKAPSKNGEEVVTSEERQNAAHEDV